MANGKKRGTQAVREINDISTARQRRRTRARGSQLQPSGVPSQGEYARRELDEAKRRELDEANLRLLEVERAPLADRKAAAATFFEAMRDYPERVAERVGWLLDGNYGHGSMLLAKRVLSSPRMNRSAALTHLAAAFGWGTPGAMARASWNGLTRGQQNSLEKAVQAAIARAESE